MPNQPSDLKSFIAMARTEDYLILDTETTGLKRPAEIWQIAITDKLGQVVYETNLNPAICPARPSFHNPDITPEYLKHFPRWEYVRNEVIRLISGRALVVYNATFDRLMFHLTDENAGLADPKWSELSRWYCAMTAFAEFHGEWDDYHGNYTWHKLVEAARYFGLSGDGAHKASIDCKITASVVACMMRDLADLTLEDIGEVSDIPFKADDLSGVKALDDSEEQNKF